MKNKVVEKIKSYVLPTGQMIAEVCIESGIGGDEATIGVIADMHFNYCNEQDLLDEELKDTFEQRTWNAGGASIKAAQKAQDITDTTDQTVILGDILDYMSSGARDLVIEHIFSRNSNALCCIGGHDYTKEMQTGKPDKLSLQTRLNYLKEFWPNDIHFDYRCVKNKVICVQMDNSQGCYLDEQVEKLQNVILKARNENNIILIFQHEPLATGNKEDEDLQGHPDMPGAKQKHYNFYSGELVFSTSRTPKEADKRIYDILKENTDIIKGIFAGHVHGVYYSDILFDNEKTIPQYTITSNCYSDYCGIIGKVIVK